MVRLDMDMNEQNDMDMTIDWRYTSESQRKSGFPHAWTTLDVYKHVGINVGIPMLQYLHISNCLPLYCIYMTSCKDTWTCLQQGGCGSVPACELLYVLTFNLPGKNPLRV